MKNFAIIFFLACTALNAQEIKWEKIFISDTLNYSIDNLLPIDSASFIAKKTLGHYDQLSNNWLHDIEFSRYNLDSILLTDTTIRYGITIPSYRDFIVNGNNIEMLSTFIPGYTPHGTIRNQIFNKDFKLLDETISDSIDKKDFNLANIYFADDRSVLVYCNSNTWDYVDLSLRHYNKNLKKADTILIDRINYLADEDAMTTSFYWYSLSSLSDSEYVVSGYLDNDTKYRSVIYKLDKEFNPKLIYKDSVSKKKYRPMFTLADKENNILIVENMAINRSYEDTIYKQRMKLTKFDEDGNIIWSNYYGLDNKINHSVFKVINTIDSCYALLCYGYDNNTPYILKLNHDGKQEWIYKIKTALFDFKNISSMDFIQIANNDYLISFISSQDFNKCFSILQMVSIKPNGVDTDYKIENTNNITITPNPLNEKALINFIPLSDKASLVLTNYCGIEVKRYDLSALVPGKQNQTEISTSDLSSGQYFLTINSITKHTSKLIIIK